MKRIGECGNIYEFTQDSLQEYQSTDFAAPAIVAVTGRKKVFRVAPALYASNILHSSFHILPSVFFLLLSSVFSIPSSSFRILSSSTPSPKDTVFASLREIFRWRTATSYVASFCNVVPEISPRLLCYDYQLRATSSPLLCG